MRGGRKTKEEKIGKIKKNWKQHRGKKPHKKVFFFSTILTNKLRMKKHGAGLTEYTILDMMDDFVYKEAKQAH